MDALILSVGTGGGHNAAGHAIEEELIKRGHHVVMMNPYDLKKGRTSHIVDNAYIKLVQATPKLFGCIYYLGNAYRYLPWRSPVYFANRKTTKLLKAHLEENHYDVVVMPHIYPAEMMTKLKDHGTDVPKTVFIATDYTCSPFVEESKCDAYTIPLEELSDEFSGFGIPKEKLVALGIPTSSCYRSEMTKADAKEALGLDATKKYILITGGSMGSGSLDRIVEHVLKWSEGKDHIPIVICGSNEKLFERISKKFGDKIIAVGYTDKMSLYMKSCEMFFTKPGGLSTTEAAVAGVPIVHITPIPGCESKNMKLFCEKGMSISAKTSEKSIFCALDYLDDPKNRDKMTARQKSINSSSAEDICDLISSLVESTDSRLAMSGSAVV